MQIRRFTRSFLALTSIALAAPAAAAHAQASTAPAGSAAPATAPWSAKPLGKYTITIAFHGDSIPADLTVSADSTGALKANFWPMGDRDGHEMTVTVKGTDLVLDGTSPRGPVQLVLRHTGTDVSGTWSIGGETGALVGKAPV